MNSLADSVEFSPEQQLRHQRKIKRIPDDLTFAGEKVHFKTADAYQRYYKELKLNAQSNSSTRLLFRNARIWLPEITAVIKANKLPEDFKYLAVAESNLSNSVSHKGAAGFWQFKEATALELGLEISDEVDERYHPIVSTRAACKYFKQSYKMFGNWTSVAASYNRGMHGLQKAFINQSVNSYYDLALNEETSRYIFRILALKDMMNSPAKYNIKLVNLSRPKMRVIRIDSTVKDLKKFAEAKKLNYDVIKEYNPWILKNTLTIKSAGRYYELIVPDIKEAAYIVNKQELDSTGLETKEINLPEKDIDKLEDILNGSS